MSKSKSGILREEIDEKIERGIDMTNPATREEYLIDLCKRRPEFNTKKSRTLVLKITQERYKIRGDRTAIAKITRKKNYKFNVKMHEELTGKPFRPTQKQKEHTTPQQPIQETQEEQTTMQETKQFPDRPVKYTHMTPENIGNVFEAILLPFKKKYGIDLTKEQKTLLGQLWLPTFQRFGNENLQYFGLPTLGTIGIVSSKNSKKEEPEESVTTEFYN